MIIMHAVPSINMSIPYVPYQRVFKAQIEPVSVKFGLAPTYNVS